MEIIQALRQCKIFFTLTDEEIQDISKNIFVKEFLQGDIIQREFSYLKSIPIILSGITKVILVDKRDARETFLYYISEGSTAATTISQGLFKESLSLKIVAETNCWIGYVPIEYFNLLLSRHPEIFQKLLEIYYSIFVDLVNSIANHVFNDMEEKILFLIHYKSNVLKSNIIETTHEELAQELNSSREVITRILGELVHKNKIKLERGKVILL